jgi:hypothetical protein
MKFSGTTAGGPDYGGFKDRRMGSQELVYVERDYAVGDEVRAGAAP